jgi:hypothetical protein
MLKISVRSIVFLCRSFIILEFNILTNYIKNSKPKVWTNCKHIVKSIIFQKSALTTRKRRKINICDAFLSNYEQTVNS